MYLLFNTQAQVNTANNIIYVNMLRDTVTHCTSFDGNIYNCLQMIKDEYDLLNDADLQQVDMNTRIYPILGFKNGKLNKTDGFTKAWDIPKQDVHGKWFIQKPDNKYMANIDNYTEVESVEKPIAKEV